MGKVKYRIGDIVMIPVDDGLFVFGRLLQDASIAIYSFVSEDMIDVLQLVGQEVLFDPGVFDTNIVNGRWKVIGNIPFNDADESWPSPKYIKDVINPNKFRIYYKGEMRAANGYEIEGLDKQVMYKPESFIEEIKKRLVIK